MNKKSFKQTTITSSFPSLEGSHDTLRMKISPEEAMWAFKVGKFFFNGNIGLLWNINI